MTRASAPERILLPLANPRTAADLVRIGAALMKHGGVLTALGIVEVPEGMALSDGATRARQARRLLQRVLEFAPPGVELRTVVRIGRRAAEGIVELAAEDEADLIIFGWGGRPGGRKGAEAVFSPTIDEVVRDSPCDIAVVKQRGVKQVKRILTPVRGGPHAELALGYAAELGRYFDATVDVMHVVPPDVTPTVRAQAERALTAFVARHAGDPARPLLVGGHNVGEAILSQAEQAQLVVMGATAMAPTDIGSADGALFGVLPETIAQHARPTVIVVKTKEPITRTTFAQRAEQAETLEAADRAAEAGRSIP
ncbi:MAG TPA: universal stress protein, partial [Candidatus Limnocylindria bacterium]|nr:universal stress protein [Candidatus Limnocylindria bacterium]